MIEIRMAFVCNKPNYILQKTDKIGEVIPTYQCIIETDTCIGSESVYEVDILSIDIENEFRKTISTEYCAGIWRECVRAFQQTWHQYFMKNYTVEQLVQHIKHSVEYQSVQQQQPQLQVQIPYMLQFIPKEIRIFQGKFQAVWKCRLCEVRIDIPDIPVVSQEEQHATAAMEATMTTMPTVVIEAGVQEVDGDNLPMNTEIESLQVVLNQSRHIEMRRVQEARLKAKLAQLRAERIMKNYLDKYGACDADSEFYSDTETDTDGGDMRM